MSLDAVFGFTGVVLGSVTTSVLTVYRDRLTVRQENAKRDQQHERERQLARDAFQRENILALQAAATDLVAAAYSELDRMLAVYRESSEWPARTWETPTAVGWSDAILRLETARARVFVTELRDLAGELRARAGDSVWAGSLDRAKQTSEGIEPLLAHFHETVTSALPALY
jgi:hypothetical protein